MRCVACDDWHVQQFEMKDGKPDQVLLMFYGDNALLWWVGVNDDDDGGDDL